jgi:hypothetical protein
MKRIALIMTAVAALTACTDGVDSQQEKAGRAATAFSEAYFNYDFKRALELTTPESAKWISFAASNITQEDVDLLNTRDGGVVVDLDECQMVNDTTYEAVLTVDNYMAADSIGRPGEFRNGGEFRLKVVLRNNKWQVKMEGLPQNEKRSRD